MPSPVDLVTPVGWFWVELESLLGATLKVGKSWPCNSAVGQIGPPTNPLSLLFAFSFRTSTSAASWRPNGTVEAMITCHAHVANPTSKQTFGVGQLKPRYASLRSCCGMLRMFSGNGQYSTPNCCPTTLQVVQLKYHTR
jgi:hypothetical protein